MRLTERPKKGVAIVYHFIPHYREAVFKLLDRSNGFDYVFVADPTSTDPSIPTSRLSFKTFVSARCYSMGRLLRWQSGLGRIALRRDIDAVIFLGNPYLLSTWVAAALARVFRKRVFFWTHGWLGRELGIRGLVRRFFYRLAHELLLYGHRAQLIGIELGFAPSRLTVIYNSLDYGKQKAVRETLSEDALRQARHKWFGSQDPVVACVARLTPECRFNELIRAVHVLRQSRPVNVILIGDGPERNAVKVLADRLCVPLVMLGELYDEHTIGLVLSAADVVVSPGKVGLTAMHSLAYGTPVVTHGDLDTQMPEAEAIEAGITGDFFPKGNVNELGRTIGRWIGAGQNRKAEIRRACIRAIEKCWVPEAQVESIERALSKHLSRGARACLEP